MLAILLTMLLIVLIAVVVLLYVVYPHRGEDVPRAPWLGEALKRGVGQLPTLDNRRERQRQR